MKQGSRGLPDEDILGERSNRRQRKRNWSYEETGDDEQHASVAIKRNRTILQQSRRKRRYSTPSESSEESDECYPSKLHSENSATSMWDQVLTFDMDVKMSDKANMSYNSILPDFDPMKKQQTVYTWLRKVEECAQIYGWDEKEMILYSLPKLCGVAKSWLHGLPTLLHPWSKWKSMLTESFHENYADLLTEMLEKRARYGEPLREYYYTKMILLNRCEISGKRAVECLLHGVDDRVIRLSAQAAQFSEPESVLKYFLSVETGNTRDSNWRASDIELLKEEN